MTDSIVPRRVQNDNNLLGGPSVAMRAIFEFDQHIGAGHYSRSDELLTNGARQRVFYTRMGSIDFAIARLREGNHFRPSSSVACVVKRLWWRWFRVQERLSVVFDAQDD